MEEIADGRCRAIYFCAGSQHHIAQLHTSSSPPPEPLDIGNAPTSSLDHVYNNVRVLLDADQGDFGQVFVGSTNQECLDTLERFTRFAPTVVLIEVGRVPAAEIKGNAMTFVRTITAGARAGHYRKPVMTFALLASTVIPDCLNQKLDVNIFTQGAVDMLRSPLAGRDLDRLVGHVREVTRPSAELLGSGMCQNLVNSIHDSCRPAIARHRPDETVTPERKRVIEEAIAHWNFPAHEFSMDELTYAAVFMLEHILRNPYLEAYGLSRPELMTLLLAVRRQYRHEREVYYHNWRHAVDVTQSIYVFLVDIQVCPPSDGSRRKSKEMNAVEHLISPLDGLILLVSAIGHDVGHPGVNNAFLVACNHQLAHMYNDKSVLENYHCAAYSQLLRRHWPSLSQIPHFRATMISTILATDMQRHFEYMGYLDDLKKKINNSQPNLSDWKDKDREHARELLMSLIIKAADISNVTRPFEISAQWARILMAEFSRQGELESELQIPTCLFGGPPNKEDVLAAAQSQKGFIDLFGFPLFRAITDIVPSLSCAVAELETNKAVWERTASDEKQRREANSHDCSLPNSYNLKEAKERASDPSVVPMEANQAPSTPIRRQPVVDGRNSPARHPASDQRNYLSLGMSHGEDKRSSAPLLGPSAVPLSPVGGPSRRSSKDVALTQLQELSLFAQQTLGPNARRESSDASWQIHQSYPNSRRGSKDESLTTILVTSQSSPSQRSSPSATGHVPNGTSPAKPAVLSKRRSSVQTSAARYSIPSSRSHTISSLTATTATEPHSPSTTPSSIAPDEDEGDSHSTPPGKDGTNTTIPATEDPFLVPGNWPNDATGRHRSPTPGSLPNSPPLPPKSPSRASGGGGGAGAKNGSSPRVISRMSSTPDLEEAARTARRKEGRTLRETRSRSRLRGLRFWKRRRDAGTESESSP